MFLLVNKNNGHFEYLRERMSSVYRKVNQMQPATHPHEIKYVFEKERYTRSSGHSFTRRVDSCVPTTTPVVYNFIWWRVGARIFEMRLYTNIYID